MVERISRIFVHFLIQFQEKTTFYLNHLRFLDTVSKTGNYTSMYKTRSRGSQSVNLVCLSLWYLTVQQFWVNIKTHQHAQLLKILAIGLMKLLMVRRCSQSTLVTRENSRLAHAQYGKRILYLVNTFSASWRNIHWIMTLWALFTGLARISILIFHVWKRWTKIRRDRWSHSFHLKRIFWKA